MCYATVSHCQELIYHQRATHGESRFLGNPIKFGEDKFLTFVTGGGLYSVDINSAGAILIGVDEAKTASACGYEYSGEKLFAWTSGFAPLMFQIEQDGEGRMLHLHNHLVGTLKPLLSENSPWLYLDVMTADSCLVTIDNGETWLPTPNLGMSVIPASNPNCLYTEGKGRVYIYRNVQGVLSIQQLPKELDRPLSIAHMSGDSVAWIENSTKRTLWVGSLSTVRGVRVDSVQLQSGKTQLDPIVVLGLEDSSAFYIDKAGWCATVKNGTWHKLEQTLQPNPVDGVEELSQPRGKYAYLLWLSKPNRVMYRIQLTSPPVIDSMIVPEGVERAMDHNKSALLYDIGDFIVESENVEYIVSFKEHKTIVTGSLITEIEYLHKRSFVYSWLRRDGDLLSCNELEQVIRVDNAKRGIVCQGKVFSTRYSKYNGAEQQTFFPNRNYREWGLSAPANHEGALVFAGPVVRHLGLDGNWGDTVYSAPASFASTLSDGTLASGWNGVLRVHRFGSTDTAAVSTPSEIIADSMGYPTSMVQCTSGTLLAAFQGTWRKDGSEEGKRLFRWGGILGSTDNGASWLPKPLPDPESNYVQHVMRTASGTLLATSMRMIEDSTPTKPSGTDPQMQSSYSANRITILRSVDCGESWSEVHTPFYNGPWVMNSGNIVQQKDGRLFAALIPGVFTSTDDGRTWTLDERVNGLIVPVSLTLNEDESMLLSANDGVYKLGKLTSVKDSGDRETRALPKPVVMSEASLHELLTSGKVEFASIVDLQGRVTVLVTDGHLIADLSGLLQPATYGLVINGNRRLIFMQGM